MTPEFCFWRRHFHFQREKGWEAKEGGAEGLPLSLSSLFFSHLSFFHFLFAYFFPCHPFLSTIVRISSIASFLCIFVPTPSLPASTHFSCCFFSSCSSFHKFYSSFMFIWITRAPAKWLFVYNVSHRPLSLACACRGCCEKKNLHAIKYV